MAIMRYGGKVEFECDGSGCHEIYVGNLGFEETWREAKEAGWKAALRHGEWMHYCPAHAKPAEPNLDAILKGTS